MRIFIIISEMTLIPVDVDDNVVFVGKKNRNFICHKVFNHMPAGSFKIVCEGWDGELIITLKNSVQFLEIGTTWKQMKRLLGNDNNDPLTYECPICCEKPDPMVLSTCDKCMNELCMKCFILAFEKTRGTVQCPWCRDITTDEKLSDEDLAFACWKMREDHRVKSPDFD